GFLAEVIISDKASFQPELLYSGQGYVGEETKKKFNYINVPLLLKYYVADNISIEAGPQVGFLINSIERGNNGNTDFEDQNVVDFGVSIGLGYEFPSGIFFQGRYNLGLTNINGSDDSDKFSYSNSVFQISVGYMLDRKSTRLNSSHVKISYAVFCLKKKKVIYSAILPVH